MAKNEERACFTIDKTSMLRHSEPVITTVRVDVSDGTEMILHVAKPASGATGSAILVLQEAYGVNGWLISVAERFAGLGFVAVAPELYHRSGHGSVLSYDAMARSRSGPLGGRLKAVVKAA